MKTQTRLVLLVALAACLQAGAALAVEFKNVGPTAVVMYDAPSSRGQKLYVAPRGMPVEVVINYGLWSKVRDFAGDLSWIETKQLVERKNILVRNLNAKIRANPDDSAEVVFSGDKGVLLELVEPVSTTWAKVKHADGSIGYVKVSDIWGV